MQPFVGIFHKSSFCARIRRSDFVSRGLLYLSTQDPGNLRSLAERREKSEFGVGSARTLRARLLVNRAIFLCSRVPPFFGHSRVGGTANKGRKKLVDFHLLTFSSEFAIVPLKQGRPNSPETLGRGSCPEQSKILLRLAGIRS